LALAPDAAIDMVPAPFVIVIPDPCIRVAGVGVAPVEPINTCPFVIDEVKTGTPELLVTKVALLAVDIPAIVFADDEYNI
jgi:hypothetical protein